jgi:hypothetical protein
VWLVVVGFPTVESRKVAFRVDVDDKTLQYYYGSTTTGTRLTYKGEAVN